MAKPWATSHISTVASGLGIELRISGDVKTQLVDILEHQLKMITREMENQTLESDPERKTLDDPNRMRLGFSRTRGMMIDNISRVDSIGAAAVVAANEQLENYLPENYDKNNITNDDIRYAMKKFKKFSSEHYNIIYPMQRKI